MSGGALSAHGNEILRNEGMATACPIVQAAKYAAVKKLREKCNNKGRGINREWWASAP